MINKTKIYEIFAAMRKVAGEKRTLIVLEKNGIVHQCGLNGFECDRIENDFLLTKRIMGLSFCEIGKIFTLGNATLKFNHPDASEVSNAIVKHFEHQNSIVFQVKDSEGFESLYHYDRYDIGELKKMEVNHKTIYFSSGKCFYVYNLKGIIPVKETLLN